MGIDYEDFRVGFSDWPGDIKATTPFGQMPVLYWDGEELAQSMAIARFVARKVGLAGNSDLEFCQADMIACHYEDIWTKLPKMKFAKSQEEREELAKEFLTEFIPKWLKPLEAILAKRGNGWFAGTGATFADLAIMCALDCHEEPKCKKLPKKECWVEPKEKCVKLPEKECWTSPGRTAGTRKRR